MTRARGPMPGHLSPALVGRDDMLALALRRWQGAERGEGHLLLITGEAGIGKSRLVAELVERTPKARMLSAAAFPRESDSPGGLLLNLADELARSGESGRAAALRDRIAADFDESIDSARRRRLLVGDLARILDEMLGGDPTLLILEDAHWADQVSLETLARLVPAIRASSSLVVVTYRSDDAATGPALAPWRAQVLAQRQAEEARLSRLSRNDVADMARGISRVEVEPSYVDLLFERSDGIPLHVEELLVSGADTVPDSVTESVRSRSALLPVETREILNAASVIGRSFDIELLALVARSAPEVVEDALDTLVGAHLVVADARGELFVFRHALLCDSVYSLIPQGRRRTLHSAIARESLTRGLADATISDHFERAREPLEAHRHALLGARAASRRSAHREAAALYRRAERTSPADLPALERALLCEELAGELLAVDDAQGAAEQLVAAIALYREEGDERAAARLVPELMTSRHLLGAGLEERREIARDALARLDNGAPAARGHESTADACARAALLAALAAALMLERRLEESAELGELAERTLAEIEGGHSREKSPDPLAVHLSVTQGAMLVFAGSGESGWARLESAIHVAQTAQWEREAARAHRMIGSSASVLLDTARAEALLARGLEYTAHVEQWNDHHYLLAHSAHVSWARGDWLVAEDLARRAASALGGITTTITALQVRGFVALGRGHLLDARQHLEESRQLAERMGEVQRISPSLWGLAELALAQGDGVTAAALCRRGQAASLAVDDAAYLIPFVVTGVRAMLATSGVVEARVWVDACSGPLVRRALPGSQPALDHAGGLLAEAGGDYEGALTLLGAAEERWVGLGRWGEGASALLDTARVARSGGRRDVARAAAATALQRAQSVGAASIAEAATALLAAPEPHGPLTRRELEVARLIATGATNRTIAESLVIAPKTVSAHVEHILAKLGASSRAQIASWVARNEAGAG